MKTHRPQFIGTNMKEQLMNSSCQTFFYQDAEFMQRVAAQLSLFYIVVILNKISDEQDQIFNFKKVEEIYK